MHDLTIFVRLFVRLIEEKNEQCWFYNTVSRVSIFHIFKRLRMRTVSPNQTSSPCEV
jgi:hypothetical protein